MLRRFVRRVTIAVVVGIFSVASTGCDLCGEDVVAEKTSPDGKFTAVTYSRNCGATTPYVTHVNLRRANERFEPGWDGAIHAREILSVRDLEPIDILWRERSVELVVNQRAIIKCVQSMEGLKVSCSPRVRERLRSPFHRARCLILTSDAGTRVTARAEVSASGPSQAISRSHGRCHRVACG
jgi:hypothetical protein